MHTIQKKKMNKEKEVNVKIVLDENLVPHKINWSADDAVEGEQEAKAMMMSFWDKKQPTAMRLDLWTKDFVKNFD